MTERTAMETERNGRAHPPAPLLSLIIPTYNESQGLEGLFTAVDNVLRPAQIPYEIVIVDDNSPDRTADVAQSLSERFPVQVLRRPGKLGLSSAVIDGWKLARGQILGVMDADLSHDPAALPSLVASIQDGQADVAVGSRYIPGGGMGNWPLYRQIVSRVAVILGSLICPVRDVTSGFFVMRRSVIDGVRLNPIGFKIALEVLVRGRYSRFTEIPYVFQDRTHGQSKLSLKVIIAYLVQLRQLVFHWLATRPRRERVAPVLVKSEMMRRN